METMYPGIVNSPVTELSAAITASATSFTVLNGAALPTAPNLAVIGNGELAETIRYTTKSGNTISGITRGLQGTARAWPQGTGIARNFTEYDYAALLANINELNLTKAGTAAATTSANGLMTSAMVTKLNGIAVGAQVNTVNSVAGKTGVVTLTAADVGLGNVTNESKTTMLNNAALTGNSTAVTQAVGDSSTKIATTAFVKAQGYLTASSDIVTNDILFGAEPIRDRFDILDYRSTSDIPRNTFSITKDNFSTVGGTQQSALMVQSAISADVANEEIGICSVLHVYGNDQHHVGIYSQVNASGADTTFLYGGCIEVKNTQLEGGGTVSNQALIGLEIDIVNKYGYDGTDLPTTRKTGISLVAWGGGTSHEAIAVYSGSEENGNGTYGTGDWLYGLIMRPNSLNVEQAIGISIQSGHSVGMRISGRSKSIGVDLSGSVFVPGSVGININENYSVAIATPSDKFIKLNGAGGNEGIFYDSVVDAFTIAASKLSLLYHTASTSATAGSSGATPSQVAGYIKCIVGGIERRIPFYNI